MTLLVKWLYHAAFAGPIAIVDVGSANMALLIPIGSTEHPIYVHCVSEETLCVQARNATALKTLITLTPTLHTQTLKVLGGILCDRSRLKQYK